MYKFPGFVENPYQSNHPMAYFLEASARESVDSGMTPRQDKPTSGYIRVNLGPFYHDGLVSSLVMFILRY
jgi:hypothetical protein